MAAPTRTPRASWIEEGLHALGVGGPDAVRIEVLAQTLGVSKGGFYWHFDDRRALLQEMLDTWERVVIDEAIERIEAGDAFYAPPGHIGVGNEPDTEYVQFSPSDKLREVSEVIMKNMQEMQAG